MNLKYLIFYLPILLLLITGCTAREIIKEEIKEEEIEEIAEEIVEEITEELFVRTKLPFVLPGSVKLESYNVNESRKQINIYLSREFSFLPIREEDIQEINETVKNYFKPGMRDYSVQIYSLGFPIEQLIPNFYRTSTPKDYSRVVKNTPLKFPIVKNLNKLIEPQNGLLDKNIVVWHSHGWYYSHEKERWEWQRPRLFETVEDLLTMSFTIPYLIPMLENAGAKVFVPRERDIQTNEVVVDNDGKSGGLYYEINELKNIQWKRGGKGFSSGVPPYPTNYNLFTSGTTREIKSDTTESALAEWIPNIHEDGFYSVYISYSSSKNNVDDALYAVYHLGGKTEFRVNQQVGGGTWIYLGRFKFSEGTNPVHGRVVLSNKSREDGRIVSADAVRFGGGEGLIERAGSASGRGKFLEAARYWLQYAGMPDTLIYSLSENKNDYTDDFRSRGEYVNYLTGAPKGPNKKRDLPGLGIPIDLSIAFHTDAGITYSDSAIGTLMIYSLNDVDNLKVFPDGKSRVANRDLGDLIQTEIVDAIRFKYDDQWTRRQLREAQYSESARPNVPSILLELLSHQNFYDMKFAHDPRFKFDVSRAIYKGALKFISSQYDFDYVVQPLPVSNFSAILQEDDLVKLTWRPVNDPLEPTAKPDYYIVYTREENKDFDNGIAVYTTSADFKITTGKIYSYKVTAANRGGESFPSEILAVYKAEESHSEALIVNGFYRIAPPASVSSAEYSGFTSRLDAGVPYKYDLSFTGYQYDFDPASPFITNDAPGHGASFADYETEIIAGNSFDYPFIHGKALKHAGLSFSSTGSHAVIEGSVNLNKYDFVNLILGKQKETGWQTGYANSRWGKMFKAFPNNLKSKIENYLNRGGNIFISGSYVGTELKDDLEFAQNILKFSPGTGYSSSTGIILPAERNFIKSDTLIFNVQLNDKIYAVEAPDEILPFSDSRRLFIYGDNNFSAVTGYKKNYGVVVSGFPFETILDEKHQTEMMISILNFLKIK
jgi:hypothetical protein